MRVERMDSNSEQPKIGIALGAGGASGLAHIPLLEELDDMGIKPHCISGSSIGAVIGALYASGLTGTEIRKLVERFFISPSESPSRSLVNVEAFHWIRFIDPAIGKGGLISGEGFISSLYDIIKRDSFESLHVPLTVVAAELWSCRQIEFSHGDLLPALKASMALPGIFEPVAHNGDVLVDGGTVNPVPYDVLGDHCDIVIAINVLGERSVPKERIPGYFDAVFNSIRAMQRTIVEEKRKRLEPTVYIAPKIMDVRVLEFYRAKQVFKEAEPFRAELRQKLTEALCLFKVD